MSARSACMRAPSLIVTQPCCTSSVITTMIADKRTQSSAASRVPELPRGGAGRESAGQERRDQRGDLHVAPGDERSGDAKVDRLGLRAAPDVARILHLLELEVVTTRTDFRDHAGRCQIL